MFPISHILPRARALYPDRLAVWDGEKRFTFEELGRRVDMLVGALKAKGVKRADRVGILDVNSYRYAEAYYACAQAGMILLPLNSRLAPPELKYVERLRREGADRHRAVLRRARGPEDRGADQGLRRLRRRRPARLDRAEGRARRHLPDLLHERHHRRTEGRMPHLPQHDRQRLRRDRRSAARPGRYLAARGADVPSGRRVVDLVAAAPWRDAGDAALHAREDDGGGAAHEAHRRGRAADADQHDGQSPEDQAIRSVEPAVHHVWRLAHAARHPAEGSEGAANEVHPRFRHHRDFGHYDARRPERFPRRGHARRARAHQQCRAGRAAHPARDF